MRQRMTMSKKRIREDDNIICHFQICIPAHEYLIKTYDLTLEELVMWKIENSDEFKYAYWECGKIPRVEVYQNEEWGNTIRARVYLEKQKP